MPPPTGRWRHNMDRKAAAIDGTDGRTDGHPTVTQTFYSMRAASTIISMHWLIGLSAAIGISVTADSGDIGADAGRYSTIRVARSVDVKTI